MAELGVALIGCGAWGMNHLRVWAELGHLRVACDPDPVRLQAVQKLHPELETSLDPVAVLERPDITAVVIATPAPTHAALALRALEHGKHVLVEKPMALTVSEGEQLVAAARHMERVLMVGHVLEYHPAVLKIRQLVDDGTLGRVQYIYSNRLNLGRIRTEENALWSFAPHDIAIVLRLLGGMPEDVACHGGTYLSHGVADVTLTTLRFPNNVRAHIFVSWLHPFKEQRFVVVGDRQMAVFDDTQRWPEKLMLYPHTVDWIGGRVPVAQRAEANPVALDQVEPLWAECAHFARCILQRERPLTGGASGLRVLRVLDAAQRSLEQDSRPARPLAEAPPPYFVHPTATVDAGAQIGAGTRIWHYTHVMPQASIGRQCNLGQNVFVASRVRIGDGVKIQNNVSVYEGVELEDEVFCGPSMVFTNVLNPRSAIERKSEYRRTLVRRGSTLGANCTIICGVKIGQYALVGSGAVVTKDVPDYALAVGVPARVAGWVCECGERLEFKGEQAVCAACGKRYTRTGPRTVERISEEEG